MPNAALKNTGLSNVTDRDVSNSISVRAYARLPSIIWFYFTSRIKNKT